MPFFAQDSWLSKILEYDKLLHFAAASWIYLILIHFLSPLLSITTTSALFLLWEIKDGLLPANGFGWLGGDGFSYKDLIASWVGAIGTYFLIQPT